MKKKFTLLIFAILASLGAMASPPQQDEGNVAKWNGTEYATLQEALDAAEAANPEHIVIDLLTDAELDVSARNSPRSIGTTDTESITINGGNNKLTINLLDSDWSDVSTANDSKTKLILNNLNLASGKYNSGHWKRNGIFFSCAVQMNNVNASCGIGFKNDATLNNVTVNTTGSNYAVWIQSNGETVNIEGLTVNGGRGIKIADEDAGTESVSISVYYSTFNTTAKAAILASTKYGAEITIGSGNDISGVVADTENFVWVDEDWANYFNTINVTGATKTLEGSIAKIGDNFYASIADAVAAASAGDVIEIFKAGTYTLPGISKNVTLEGTVEGVEFTHTTAGNVASIPNGCTFKNITFNFGNVNYHGFEHAGTINMEGCTLNGKFFSYGDMNFTNCEFNQTNADYHMWVYGPSTVRYTECTFTNTNTGKFLNIYREGPDKNTVYIDKCKFINQGSVNKAAANVKATSGANLLTADVYITESTTEGLFPEATTTDPLVVLNNLVQVDDRTADGVDNIRVWQDNVQIYPPTYVAQIGETKYLTLTEAFAAAQKGETVTLLVDYDATDETMYDATRNLGIDTGIIFDGDGHTLTVKGSGIAVGKQASEMLDVTFQNITILNTSKDARCIDTRGHIKSLVLDNVTLNTQGASGTMQPLTIGGNQTDHAKIYIKNGSTIQTNDDATGYYAIITFNPVDMEITGSTIKGWACIYAKGANSSAGSDNSGIDIKNSTLVSKNIHSQATNAFAAIMIEDKDVWVDAKNTTFNIINTGDQMQALVGYDPSVTSGYIYLDEGNKIAFDNQGSGSCEFVFNQPENSTYKILGGVFTDQPDESLLNTGLVVVDNDDPIYKYTVATGSYVAQIGDKKYISLQKAVDAATANGGENTITLLADITGETVTIQEKANLQITIDGKKDDSSNYTVDAIIVVDGLRGNGGSNTNGASVTLQNIAFVNGDYITAQNKSVVQASHYPHDLTIQDCTYTGKDTEASRKLWFFDASYDGPLYGATLKNLTVEHSRLAYANLANEVVFENIKSNDAYAGFNIKTSGTALIKNCQITTSKYAFRDYTDEYEGTITLEGNTFISTSTESDEGAIVNRGGKDGTGHINVVSGTYVGAVKVLNGKENVLTLIDGHYSAPIYEDAYAGFIVENKVGKKDLYVDETPEAPNGIGDPVYVAQIGEDKYTSLQKAVDAAYTMTGDVTIELIDDITEYAVVKQKENLNLTIEGKDGEENHTITGQIVINGMNRSTGTETLAIKDINFSGESDNFITIKDTKTNQFVATDAFILVPNAKLLPEPHYANVNNYAHNVTVDGCSFTSNSESLNVVGLKANSGAGLYNITIKNSTGSNLHSLAQLTATTGGAITDNTVTESESFMNVNGGGGEFTVSGNTFTTAETAEDGYGVRENASSTAVINLTDNNFTAANAVVLGKTTAVTAGTINVVSGTYVGDITKTDAATGKIIISGGHFSAPLGDSEYAAFIAEGLSGVNGIYLSETPEAPNGVGEAVAELTTGSRTTKYASLEAAFADAIDGSAIKLLKDCAGNGIVVPKGKFPDKGLEVDFNEKTYTVDGSTVGSAGTETNGFQLLMDNKITFMNGTIYSEKAKILVQNYSDLTLTDEMKLDLNNPNYTSAYTLSNNNGNIYINQSTINANPAGGFAFDVCRFSSYPSVTVTVTGGSDINGDVEVSASGSDAKEGFTLMLEDGVINGDLVLDASAKAAMNATPDIALVLEQDDFNQPAPEGYMWIPTDAPSVSKLVPENYVAQIGDVKYTSLAKAVAAVPADGTETTITMIDNEMINVVGYAVTIPATKNIVLDLNGYQIVGTVNQEGTSALIRNLGTLTIKDSSDTNADGTGTGKLMSGASSTWTWDGTDDYSGSYATNLIRNEKELTVESGYLYNMSLGSAAYAIDNYSAGNITIKGGKVDAAKASAIRMFYVNGGSITVKGGDIGHYVSDDDCSYMGIQVMSGDNVNVSITDGTIHGLYALYAGNSGGMIDISGGTFDGYVGIGAVVPNISISGGAYNSWVGTWGEQTKFVSGGIYAEEDIDEEIIADGYIFTDNTDEATKDVYPYMVRPAAYVAQNVQTETKYEAFEEAVAAVDNGQTIELLADVAMAENITADKSFTLKTGEFTFDPAGHTITIAQTGVTVNVEIAASIIDNFDSSVDGFKVEETVIANGYAYSLVPVEDLDLATIEEGYYNIMNVGNSKYVNVKGRKTATVDASEATSAGTVIKVKATEGKVEILRSQAVDIPSYAQRAMRYVPEVVTLVVDKLGVDGSGKILGETGVDAILEKFYDEFDPNLYVENVDGGYRIFGRTPSMQPVLDFYKENKANVDAKLPELEQAVNDAIALVVDKLGMGTSLKDSFKLHTIWERMGATNLIEPVDDASKLLFLQEVLSSKNHVWNFAYQTATFYADEVEGKLDQIEGISEDMDVSKYIELAKKIRPDFKYYIVQNEDKMDIISEGNIDIINNADRAVWQIEAAETMTVNVPEENSRIVGATFDESGKRIGFEKGYYTTLYTDFAYQLPEGAVALKVTEIKDAMLGDEPLTYESGDATLTLGLLVTEEIGQEVPAQTPVLIMSKTAGDINITIGDDFGASADVSKNILRGADYLISEYEINTPMLESLYSFASEKVSGLDKYEHLIRKNSGTVNNKYFFSLTMQEIQDAYKAKTGYEMQTSPILTLSKQTGKKLAFNESWDNIQPNSVFLVSEQTKPALFTLTGDVTRDGEINVQDVTGQTNIIQFRDKQEYNYDYEAADVIYIEGTDIEVSDVTGEVNIIQKRTKHPDLP